MGSFQIVLFVGGLIFAALSVFSLVYAFMYNNADKKILSWASGSEPVKSKHGWINFARPLIHSFTVQHALRIKNVRYRKRVEKLLITAGLTNELNVDEFIGAQILFGAMFPVLFGVFNVGFDMGMPWILFGLMVPLGAYYPHISCRAIKNRRENSVRRDLPIFADILALSTEAGLDFITSIQRIVDKADDESVLAQELRVVLKDIKLGASRADALRGMSRRVDASEVMSFVAVLVDADATGASISQVLKDQSVQIRLERFVRAEKAGAKSFAVDAHSDGLIYFTRSIFGRLWSCDYTIRFGWKMMAILRRKQNSEVLLPNLKTASYFFDRMKGLLGTDQLEQGEGLWIKECGSVHTFFMRYPIDCVFVDKNLKVVGVKNCLLPYRVTWPIWRADSVIEAKAGWAEQNKIQVGDELYVGN